jgi:hypothetical protein
MEVESKFGDFDAIVFAQVLLARICFKGLLQRLRINFGDEISLIDVAFHLEKLFIEETSAVAEAN